MQKSWKITFLVYNSNTNFYPTTLCQAGRLSCSRDDFIIIVSLPYTQLFHEYILNKYTTNRALESSLNRPQQMEEFWEQSSSQFLGEGSVVGFY